jgi:muramoyltetrapeptide carboxypeptidase
LKRVPVAGQHLRRPRAPSSPATIGVFALSGSVDPARLDQGIGWLQGAGHRVVTAPETRLAWRYFAGTDAERLAGFHRLLDDPSIDLMLAARGGYGISRLLADIDWKRVGASRKAFAGFSDFTAFNCAALACADLATLHAPMLASDFGDAEPDAFMLRHFAATTWGARDSQTVACEHGYPQGSVAGTLWGGNLSMLAHLVGTPYLPAVDGGLLYVEEIAEDPYAIERLFLQLHHAGVLPRQAAILLGEFTDCVPNNQQRYPYSMAEAIETLREIAPCPVLTGLPFGHAARKLTLPFGMPAELSLGTNEYSLSWPGLGAA